MAEHCGPRALTRSTRVGWLRCRRALPRSSRRPPSCLPRGSGAHVRPSGAHHDSLDAKGSSTVLVSAVFVHWAHLLRRHVGGRGAHWWVIGRVQGEEVEGNPQEEQEECPASLGTGRTVCEVEGGGGGDVAGTRSQRSDKRRRPQDPSTGLPRRVVRGTARGNQWLRLSVLGTSSIQFLRFFRFKSLATGFLKPVAYLYLGVIPRSAEKLT